MSEARDGVEKAGDAARAAKAAVAVGDADELRHDQTIGPVDLTRWTTPPGRALAGSAEKTSDRVGSRGTLILILVVGGVIAIALSFIASRIYDSVTESDGVAGFDRPVLNFMIALRTPAIDSIVTAYTNIAGPIGMPILAVAAILILSLRRRSWTPAILIAAAGIGSLAMTIAGKDIIGRVRPPLSDAVAPYEYSPSFPSGHTLNAVVIAGVVAYLLLLRRSTTHGRVLTVTVAALFALTIGLSRVFLGHHWFTDVLAAWVLGAAWLALIITAHRLYITVRARHPAAIPGAPSPSA
jgi:membrane-associated phospholipid phosphatase